MLYERLQQLEQDLAGASGQGPLRLASQSEAAGGASSSVEQKLPRWGNFCVPAKIAASFHDASLCGTLSCSSLEQFADSLPAGRQV